MSKEVQKSSEEESETEVQGLGARGEVTMRMEWMCLVLACRIPHNVFTDAQVLYNVQCSRQQ